MAVSPVVLGLDFGGTKIAAAVGDLDGNRLASTTTGSGGALGAAGQLRPRDPGRARPAEATAPGSELAAVGVSTFGIPFEDRVELAPAIDGWDKLAMGRELRAAFAGAQHPDGHRRQGGGRRPRPAGARWPAAIPPST